MLHRDLVSQVKRCRSKIDFENLFLQNQTAFSMLQNHKALDEIFQVLQNEANSQNYLDIIWISLLKACQSSWHHDLGVTMADYVAAHPSSDLALQICRNYIDAGKQAKARAFAKRILRRKGIPLSRKLQFSILIAQSYIYENQRSKANSIIVKTDKLLSKTKIPSKDLAGHLSELGKLAFYLGHYSRAATYFFDAYQRFLEVEDAVEASRNIFNAAAAYFNEGQSDLAYTYVEESRKLATKHSLYGHLSHVETFYGHEEFWKGHFANAKHHFKLAYRNLPKNDHSFRTIHVLSMLTLVYLRTGQFKLAARFGEKTMLMAKDDDASKFRTRFEYIQAELLWEQGNFQESLDYLDPSIKSLQTNGVTTLEELSSMNRYIIQSALLHKKAPLNVHLSDSINQKSGDYLEYLYALGLSYLIRDEDSKSLQLFVECQQKAEEIHERYYRTWAILGQFWVAIKRRSSIDELKNLMRSFEIAVARIPEAPLKAHLSFIQAAIAYQQNDFQSAMKHLESAPRLSKMGHMEQRCLDAWMQTMEGHAIKFSDQPSLQLLAQLTKLYFRPSVCLSKNNHLVISEIYHVDLSHHEMVREVIHYLIQHRQCDDKELLVKVWHESTRTQGWQQKIRNTLFRIRSLTPQTMAPFILSHDSIQFFDDAIEVRHELPSDHSQAILKLLKNGPMSTQNISSYLRISSATAKRALKNLVDSKKIQPLKNGRNVEYREFLS
jgi:tetratricopeptide (TPR) repeat protein